MSKEIIVMTGPDIAILIPFVLTWAMILVSVWRQDREMDRSIAKLEEKLAELQKALDDHCK